MIFLIYIADLKLIPVKVTVHSSCYSSGGIKHLSESGQGEKPLVHGRAAYFVWVH
jgi:hypothetical protein